MDAKVVPKLRGDAIDLRTAGDDNVSASASLSMKNDENVVDCKSIGGDQSIQTCVILQPGDNPDDVSSYLLVLRSLKEGSENSDNPRNSALLEVCNNEKMINTKSESIDETDKSKFMNLTIKKSRDLTRTFACDLCNYSSDKRYLFTRHKARHSEERRYKCDICNRDFKTKNTMLSHINTHTGLKPHHCTSCPSKFNTSGELVRHVRYKHTMEKPHKCTLCDYACVELGKMRSHLRKYHTGEHPFQCQICNYACSDSFKLKRHLLIHTGERPYKCNICHATFTQSNSLKYHESTHTENRSIGPFFKCSLCPRQYLKNDDLRVHTCTLHSCDKVFTCEHCGQDSPDLDRHKTHLKTHSQGKSHVCSICDLGFTQKRLLSRHHKMRHNLDHIRPPLTEKQYECAECRKTFYHKTNLRRHIKRSHDLVLGKEKQNVNDVELQIIAFDENEEQCREKVEMSDKILINQTSEDVDGSNFVVPILNIAELSAALGRLLLYRETDESGELGEWIDHQHWSTGVRGVRGLKRENSDCNEYGLTWNEFESFLRVRRVGLEFFYSCCSTLRPNKEQKNRINSWSRLRRIIRH